MVKLEKLWLSKILEMTYNLGWREYLRKSCDRKKKHTLELELRILAGSFPFLFVSVRKTWSSTQNHTNLENSDRRILQRSTSLSISRQASSEVTSVIRDSIAGCTPHFLPSIRTQTGQETVALLHIWKNWAIAYRFISAYYLQGPTGKKNGATMIRQLLAVKSQNCACPSAPRPSQHRRCTSVILSTGLQMPVQFQSKDAAHGFPACAFHSQSARSSQMGHDICADYSEKWEQLAEEVSGIFMKGK